MMTSSDIGLFVQDALIGEPSLDDIIVKATRADEQWIEDRTTKIGEWRDELRSTYLRWGLAINGLEVAAER